MIVLDASVLAAAADADDPHHNDARALLTSGRPLATLDLAVYEVTNVGIRWDDQQAVERLLTFVWTVRDHGTLIRVELELAASTAAIAAEHRLSAYDAAYVAAARQHGAQLASCDVRDLVGAGLAELPGDLL